MVSLLQPLCALIVSAPNKQENMKFVRPTKLRILGIRSSRSFRSSFGCKYLYTLCVCDGRVMACIVDLDVMHAMIARHARIHAVDEMGLGLGLGSARKC